MSNWRIRAIAGSILLCTACIHMAHVPYKGAGPAMVDLLGGHVPVGFVIVDRVRGESLIAGALE